MVRLDEQDYTILTEAECVALARSVVRDRRITDYDDALELIRSGGIRVYEGRRIPKTLDSVYRIFIASENPFKAQIDNVKTTTSRLYVEHPLPLDLQLSGFDAMSYLARQTEEGSELIGLALRPSNGKLEVFRGSTPELEEIKRQKIQHQYADPRTVATEEKVYTNIDKLRVRGLANGLVLVAKV